MTRGRFIVRWLSLFWNGMKYEWRKLSWLLDCISILPGLVRGSQSVRDSFHVSLHNTSSHSFASSGCLPVSRVVQYWLDKSTVHTVPRWCGFGFLLFLFFLRVYLVQGYFIVAYGLGIYLLNNFIAFLSPLEDPTDSPGLPTTESEGKEYRPFARRLPEFKFWLACTRGTATSIMMTFFSVFDVPVFWPILLMYFFILFFMTMKRQIMHMYKHKYVPISFGKSKYKNAGKETGMFGGGMHKGK